MLYRPHILEDIQVYNEDGTITHYYEGEFLTLRNKDEEMTKLEEERKIELLNPFDTPKITPDDYRRLVYLGKKPDTIWEYGLLHRCIPEVISKRKYKAFEALNEFPYYTILDFCDEHGVYISHNTTISDFDEHVAPYIPNDPNILIMRDEGAGDVIMSIPTVRALKKKYPLSNITYAVKEEFMDIPYKIDCIDKVIRIEDIDLTKNSGWDLVINWCRALEVYRVERNRKHRIDSFSLHIGLGKLEDKKTEIHFKESEVERAWDLLYENGKEDKDKIIGYVIQSASYNRTWQPWRVRELCETFKRELPDYKIVLIDKDKLAGFEAPNVIDLCGKTGSFMQAAAVVSMCDILVTQDTGLAHIAGALEIPCVVIIGSIPPKARYSTYKNFNWVHLKDRMKCCPCWDFQIPLSATSPLSKEKKKMHLICIKKKTSKCLDLIEPIEIVEKTKEMLER